MLLGLAVAGGVAWWWSRGDACLGRCGDGTRCQQGRCLPVPVASPSTPAVTKERRRRSRQANGDAPAAPPEAQLKPGDDKVVAQGDVLGRPEHIDLSQPGAPERELSQDDLDRVFRPSQPAVQRCITDAVGDAPLERGQIEVGMRVERTGQVSRVRVEAPALLQRQGLTRCVRGVVTALRFPVSGGANVVTYPFELQ